MLTFIWQHVVPASGLIWTEWLIVSCSTYTTVCDKYIWIIINTSDRPEQMNCPKTVNLLVIDYLQSEEAEVTDAGCSSLTGPRTHWFSLTSLLLIPGLTGSLWPVSYWSQDPLVLSDQSLTDPRTHWFSLTSLLLIPGLTGSPWPVSYWSQDSLVLSDQSLTDPRTHWFSLTSLLLIPGLTGSLWPVSYWSQDSLVLSDQSLTDPRTHWFSLTSLLLIPGLTGSLWPVSYWSQDSLVLSDQSLTDPRTHWFSLTSLLLVPGLTGSLWPVSFYRLMMEFIKLLEETFTSSCTFSLTLNSFRLHLKFLTHILQSRNS